MKWDWSAENSFIDGIKHSYPVCIAFLFIFSSIGMLGHAENFNLVQMLIMSITIFAGPSQALIINNYDIPILALAINAFILNFKFILMSSVLLPLWRRSTMTIPSLHFICSSTYMVCSVAKDVKDPWLFYLGVGIPSYFIAILATASGYMLWQIGTDHQTFLHALAHIVLPVHFTCLTMKRKKEKMAIAATGTGFVLTPILSQLVNPYFMVVIWIIIAGLFVIGEDKICGKRSV